LPKCSAGNDYYFANKQVVRNPREMKKFIAEKLEQGKRNFVFKIAEAHSIENITERVLQTAASKYEEMFNTAVKINLNYNLKQGVFEIDFCL
jgi:DNA polymerase III delta prime subunit